ncbi:MAG: GC-type dockerin domain-anchored protein [Flavobacteriales bacterium]
MRHLLLTFLGLFSLVSLSKAQLVCGLGDYQHQGCEHGLQAIPEDKFTFIPPPAYFDAHDINRASNITVNYNGFPANAEAAFEYAVAIWESTLTSSVPIIIDANWASLAGGTLGFAGANGFYINFPGNTAGNTFFPQALANKLRGSDNGVGTEDISCTFNSNFSWYFGTDGNTPGGQYDFVTVVLHELGHGLGFLGSGDVSGGNGSIGFGGTPLIYDTFVENNTGSAITSFPNNSAALASQLQGNNLYWNGPLGMANNGGTRPRIYAPGTFNGGSSYSHLNESTYPAGNVNSLMTPFLGSAEANHDPGPIVEGMFEDMGWSLEECLITGISVDNVGACNPANNNHSVDLIIEYSSAPAFGLLNVNGATFNITSSPQTITLTTLPSDGSGVDITAFFTALPDCIVAETDLYVAPEICCTNLRLEAVNPDLNQISIKNHGVCAQQIGTYRLCTEFQYGTISTMTIVSGSANVTPGSTTVLEWADWTPTAAGADMGLYLPSGAFSSTDAMVDFTQWGTAGNGRESVAVAKGIWSAGDFATGIAPYNYTGDGIDTGVAFWEGSIPPCFITQIAAGIQSACNSLTGEYTQAIAITYQDAPATGTLDVNGVSYPITGSPQVITLTLPADGLPVTISAEFSDDAGCSLTESNLFTAPSDCFCPTDLNTDGSTNVQDLLALLAQFACTENCTADLNNDGNVAGDDLLVLLASFGNPCP